MRTNSRATLTVLLLLAVVLPAVGQSFVNFESQQFRPLAVTPNGRLLLVTNTPDNSLEIFAIDTPTLEHRDTVMTGLEPVAVVARTDDEVWVVNRLSDSVSIVSLSGAAPRVLRTLLVGDEPADIVFAGPGRNRAFITTAHRGQNSPYTDPGNPGELTTPGVGRADVWVFDAQNLGTAAGGTPVTVVTLFGDSPGPLASSADGSTVYAGVFKSGNQTATVPSVLMSAVGLPPPTADSLGNPQPDNGLIVKFDGSAWRDELGRDLSGMLRFNLPDLDVFAINAVATTPVQSAAFPHVGTVLYAMAVNPASGRLYVANTDANNAVRFAGTRAPGSTVSTVQGNLHRSQITVIEPATGVVTPRHLNKHINYALRPAPAGVKERSLALPVGIAVTQDGSTLYVAAKGSNKVGVFDVAALEDDSFTPDGASHIPVTGGGPAGLALDEARSRLYVLTRFDNAVSVLDTIARAEIAHQRLPNPEPATVISGRPLLYDANLTSSNGEASCAVCHVSGDKDELAWDIGDPDKPPVNNPNPVLDVDTGLPSDRPGEPFHSMKGPMTTQTLMGLSGHGPMHWRGDRSAGTNLGGDPLDEIGAFLLFNEAFVSLQGRTAEVPKADMQALTDFAMTLTLPPNAIRSLDDSLTPMQSAGRDAFFNFPSVFHATCSSCHPIEPENGSFGTAGFSSSIQLFKIPHLRNIYTKVGMFGMAAGVSGTIGGSAHMGDQIRGFGMEHDGRIDTVARGNQALALPDPTLTRIRNLEQFVFAFDADLKPVVGQQITLAAGSPVSVIERVDLLIARAAAGDADLVVKGLVGGLPRGWHRLGDGRFVADRASDAPLSATDLRQLAQQSGQELTFTAVPVGSGQRIGVDRDGDAVLNNDDNCPLAPNPNQADADSNGRGDVCELDFVGGPDPDPEPVPGSSGGGGSMSPMTLGVAGLVALLWGRRRPSRSLAAR